MKLIPLLLAIASVVLAQEQYSKPIPCKITEHGEKETVVTCPIRDWDCKADDQSEHCKRVELVFNDKHWPLTMWGTAIKGRPVWVQWSDKGKLLPAPPQPDEECTDGRGKP